MKCDKILEILQRILDAQKNGNLAWGDEDPATGWRCTEIGSEQWNTICYRFRYIEAEPQIGADPYILQLMMPGLNATFFIGTEGYELLYKLHCETTGTEYDEDVSGAIRFLERNDL